MTNPCDDFDSNECQEALLSIYEYLDGHLEVERRTIIATHIEVCSYCNDTYSFEMHVRKVVSTRCSERDSTMALGAKLRTRPLSSRTCFACDPAAYTVGPWLGRNAIAFGFSSWVALR